VFASLLALFSLSVEADNDSSVYPVFGTQCVCNVDRPRGCTSLVRHADGNVAIDSDEHRHPDGQRLHDEYERQEVDERQLVAVVLIGRVPAGVIDQVGHAEDRHDGDQHQRISHRQSLAVTIRPISRILFKFIWIKIFSADIRISRIYAENRKFG